MHTCMCMCVVLVYGGNKGDKLDGGRHSCLLYNCIMHNSFLAYLVHERHVMLLSLPAFFVI